MFVASLFTKPTAEQQGLIGRLTYAIPLLIAFFLLLKGVSNQPAPGIGLKQSVYPLYLSVMPETFYRNGDGVSSGYSRFTSWTLGASSPGINWSGLVTYKEDHDLSRKGRTQLLDTLSITALLLMYVGTSVTLGNLGGFLGFPFFVISCWIKLKQEESLMTKHFEENYTDYKKRVKSFDSLPAVNLLTG